MFRISEIRVMLFCTVPEYTLDVISLYTQSLKYRFTQMYEESGSKFNLICCNARVYPHSMSKKEKDCDLQQED